MGVTFKISKIGSRYRHQPQLENADEDNVAGSSKDSSRIVGNNDSASTSAQNPEVNVICGARDVTEIPDCEVSFVLNLFPDSYSVTKPSVNESGNQDSQKLLRPYDKTCEILSTAIERGQLPADILGDFPFKYKDGVIVCEVRDYRKCTPEVGTTTPFSSLSPIIQKVRLKMSLANIVKDMPLISDDTWTYGDMMEVESRILRALQPTLCLDPTPKLGRLCTNPVINKLDLDVSSIRRKRLKQIQDSINTSNCALNGNNGYIDRVPESSVSGLPCTMQLDANDNISTQNVSPMPNMMTSRVKYGVTDPSTTLLPLTTQQLQQPQSGMANQRLMMTENNVSGPLMNVPGASPVSQEPMYSYANSITNVHGKRDYPDGPNSHLSGINKQMRVTVANAEASQQQQQIGQHMDNFQASNIQWKNARGGIQYQNSSGTQKYPQQIYEDSLALNNGGQPGMRLIAKDEPIEMERFDKQETNPIKSDMQQRLSSQHAFMRSNFPQTPWNNQGQSHEMSTRKDEQSQKRKTAQSPRISVGGFPQSPLSSKSGEFSSGSMGPQFGPAVTSSLAVSQKDKAAVNSKPTAGGGATSSDSLQRHSHIVAKRRPNSQPKNSAISGVSSPATVGNMGIVPHNISSPPVGTSLGDQKLIERLVKIDMLSTRFKLNSKANNKGVENYHVRNPGNFPKEHVSTFLSNDMNYEIPRDETCTMPLSKSLIGGNLNVNKIRVLNFVMPESNHQGERFPAVPRTRTRMIMSEKSNDDTIAMHFGDIDDNEFLAAEDYLPTLPTAHYADLLAAELCSQMIHSGYHVEDHLQVKPLNRTNHPLSNQPNTTPGTPSGNPSIEIQQNTDSAFSQLTAEAPKPTNSGNTATRMLPPLNNQPLQISQGLHQSVPLPSRPPQQPDSQPSSLQQQQAQQSMTPHPSIQQPASQFQRSSAVMLPGNNNTLLSQMNANPQMGNNPMSYGRPSSVQLQMLQQQQQQQPQLQRKMMMGLGPAANNISGLGGLGNIMGMGGGGSGGVGQRGMGVGPSSMSSQMGQISGMGNNVGQNPMSLGQATATNINNALRSGQITPTQAQIMAKLKMAQTRSNMLGGPQAAGARQMLHPGSTTTTSLQMLGQTPNRGNLNPNQNRSAIMGPPKMMPGMNNMYMNPQQQLQHQQQLQFQQMHQFQQHQQQFLQQQQQQQQELTTSSPVQSGLTNASSPQVVGSSPSTMSVNQMMNQQMLQQASSQQMNQQQQASSPHTNQQQMQQASSQHMNQQQMQQQANAQQINQQQASSQHMNQQQMQQQVNAQQMNQQQMQQQANAQQMNQQQMQQQANAQQMNQQQMQQQLSAQQMNQMQQQVSAQQMNQQQMQQQVSAQQMNQQQVSAQQMNQQQMQQQVSAQHMNQQQMQQQASAQQMNQQQASAKQMNQQQMQQQASAQQMNQQHMQQQASAQQMNQQHMQQQVSAQQMNQQQQMQQQVSAQQIQQQTSAQQMKQHQMQQQASAQQMSQQQMQQQASSQQMNQRTTQMSPQLRSTGNVEASCSPPPPLNNNNNSSIELQGGANRTNSTNNG